MMNDILNQLRENGCRITPQRKEIIRILFASKEHPKAEDIYEALKAEMPETSLATVYNTLNRLKELGLINVIGTVGEESVRFDPDIDPHDHLYCMECNRIFDIERIPQAEPQHEYAGFQAVRQQTTIYGYCSQCRDKVDSESPAILAR